MKVLGCSYFTAVRLTFLVASICVGGGMSLRQCGRDLTTSQGEIKTPDYPFMNYQNNADCEWKIRVEEGLVIQLKFINFQVESSGRCKYDSLEIYNGGTKDSSKRVAKLCGSDLPDPIESSGNELLLWFHSDNSVNSLGFRLQYTTRVKCGGKLTTSTGVIKSPGFPVSYPEHADCQWTIRVEEGSRIKLTFTDFEVKPSRTFWCNGDYLNIYNGKTKELSNRVANLCGSDLPAPLVSSGNELLLSFQSFFSSNNYKGFKLQFVTVTCGGDLTTSTGEIKSPRFPSSYPDSVDCEWTIRVEEDSWIKLTFTDFEVETTYGCEYDSLEVYNVKITDATDDRIAKLCGSDLPDPIESRGNKLRLMFHSDRTIHSKGFKLQFATIVPPQAPARFSVNATTSTSIRASWQLPPSDFRHGIVRGFKLFYKKKGSAGSPTKLIINDGATLNKSVTGLDKFTEYEFQVSAFSSQYEGQKSPVKVVKTKEDVPSQAPANFSLTAASSTSIQATWQIPPPDSRNGIIIGFKLLYKKNHLVNSSNTMLTIHGGSNLTKTVTGLAKYTEYEFQLLAFTSVGDGPKSSIHVLKTKEDVPSQAPVNLSLTPISSASILASWQLPPPDSRNGIILGFKLFFKKKGSAATPTRLFINGGSTLNKTVAGLAKFTEYEFEVLAFTYVGDGTKSFKKVQRTKEDIPSQAPVRFSVGPTSSTSIRASWRLPPAYARNGIIRGFKVIYKKKGFAGSLTILVINDGATINKTVTGLDKFTEYAFYVLAFTSVGDGRRSHVVYARTNEDVPSRAPANLSVTSTSSTSIRASWQLPPANSRNGIILGCKLFYKKRGCAGPPSWLPVTNGATLTNVTWLAKYTEYEFQVLAFTSVGDGPKSSVTVERTKEDVPSQAPASLSVTATSSTSILASWQLPPADVRNGIIMGYKLFYQKKGSAGSPSILVINNGTTLTKNVTGLFENTEYEFQVLAFTSVGDGPKSPIKAEKTKEDD